MNTILVMYISHSHLNKLNKTYSLGLSKVELMNYIKTQLDNPRFYRNTLRINE